MYEIGVAVAGANMPAEVKRAVECIEEHENTVYPYRIKVVTELDDPNLDPVCVNVSRLRNIGVRDLLKDCKRIAVMDADYLMPPGLLDWCVEETHECHVYVVCRDLDPQAVPFRHWIDWLQLPTRECCWASFNCMTSENWRRIGGWDERCAGWGGEDDILHIRTEAAGIPKRVVRTFPLMHVKHPPRPFRTQALRARENMLFADQPQPNYLEGNA